MKKRVNLRANLSVKAEASIPTRFEILAYTGGLLNVDGYDLPVVIDLAGLKYDDVVPIAVNHDTTDDMILGQTEPGGITNDGKCLILAGPITADLSQSPTVKRVITMAQKGHQWQASVGAELATVVIDDGQDVFVNGRTLTGPFELSIETVLRETSVLAMGADKNTRVVLARMKGSAIMSFEDWVKSLGIDLATVTEDGKNLLMQQYAAIQEGIGEPAEGGNNTEEELAAEGETDTDEEETPAPPVKAKAATAKAARRSVVRASTAAIQASNKAYADNERRISKIKATCGTDSVLMTTAIEKGWTAAKAELEFRRRQDRKSPPSGHRREGQSQGMLQALQGAMILRAGGKIDLASYSGVRGLAFKLPTWLRAGLNTDTRQKAMESAWQFRDMSMVDLCRACCEIDGVETDGSRRGYIQAAVSGGSLADIFNTSINAQMIEKLEEHGDTTIGWTREAEANNFQPMDRTRLVKGGKLTRHARGGTADHATRSDVNEQYKIARYSQMFEVDEQDIIDDAFQAISDMPDEMALACSRLRPDLVYSIVLGNPTLAGSGQALFSATQPGTQSNLVASGGALSAATVQAAMAAIFNVLENGVGVNAPATHMLVPMVLFGAAASLLQGQNIAIAGTAGTVTQVASDVNPLVEMQKKMGKIELVSDQRLTNGVVDPVTDTTYSGSATTWRMVSNKVRGIEVAYLKGTGRGPQIRQYILDKGRWGLGWDVNLDIGAKALEWRGFFESRA